MFSIKIDKDIYHGVDMMNVDELIPHEKVVENKKNILKYNKWSPYAFMSQANYLLSYDILNDIDIENIGELTSIKKLIMPNQMGEIFKVLIAGKNMKNNSNMNFIKNDVMKL